MSTYFDTQIAIDKNFDNLTAGLPTVDPVAVVEGAEVPGEPLQFVIGEHTYVVDIHVDIRRPDTTSPRWGIRFVVEINVVGGKAADEGRFITSRSPLSLNTVFGLRRYREWEVIGTALENMATIVNRCLDDPDAAGIAAYLARDIEEVVHTYGVTNVGRFYTVFLASARGLLRKGCGYLSVRNGMEWLGADLGLPGFGTDDDDEFVDGTDISSLEPDDGAYWEVAMENSLHSEMDFFYWEREEADGVPNPLAEAAKEDALADDVTYGTHLLKELLVARSGQNRFNASGLPIFCGRAFDTYDEYDEAVLACEARLMRLIRAATQAVLL